MREQPEINHEQLEVTVRNRKLTLRNQKSKANSDHWRRSKQLSSNEEASRGQLSNHDILIPFPPSSSSLILKLGIEEGMMHILRKHDGQTDGPRD